MSRCGLSCHLGPPHPTSLSAGPNPGRQWPTRVTVATLPGSWLLAPGSRPQVALWEMNQLTEGVSLQLSQTSVVSSFLCHSVFQINKPFLNAETSLVIIRRPQFYWIMSYFIVPRVADNKDINTSNTEGQWEFPEQYQRRVCHRPAEEPGKTNGFQNN